MAKIEITRTELVWPGKYDEEGNLVPPRRVNLPFQVIERLNETRAARQQWEEELAGHVGSLFDDEGWRNKLIWGDNLYVMGSLLEHFAGKIDLVYIDPPLATGADFSFKREIAKEESVLEEGAYRDTWGEGLDSYLQMMYERVVLIRELLSERGSLYLHCDWRANSALRLLMDEVFGQEAFVNQVIWAYEDIGGRAPPYFKRKHDTLLFYGKSEKRIFNIMRKGLSPSTVEPYEKYFDAEGRITYRRLKETDPGVFAKLKGVRDLDEVWLDKNEGAPLNDWWADISPLESGEDVGYDTQKPEALLERVVRASSVEGSLVADFFCGSGTTLAVAERLGRRWIGCDMSRYAVHVTRKRLMDMPECRPFEILSLGKHERQAWQGVTFGGRKRTEERLIFEYLKFILELYGAQPLAGTEHIHGKKGNAMVHVGAVDAPVTIDEINVCLAECKAMLQQELHILGWEWETGIAGLMVEEAQAQGIKLLLLTIPRAVMEQQAVEKGDIHFYQLACLEAEVKPSRKKHSVTFTLTGFVIPNDELIPPEVRAAVEKWSDYVDYWAVDWDFRNDTFVTGWTSYRTQRDRSLKLKTDRHVYQAPGKYRILVKVIDIFGNDTSQLFEVDVE